jgi:hypothetical protein
LFTDILQESAVAAAADGFADTSAYSRSLFELGVALLAGARQEEWLGRWPGQMELQGLSQDGWAGIGLAADACYVTQAVTVLREAVRWMESDDGAAGRGDGAETESEAEADSRRKAKEAQLARAQLALAEALRMAGMYEAAKQILEQVPTSITRSEDT